MKPKKRVFVLDGCDDYCEGFEFSSKDLAYIAALIVRNNTGWNDTTIKEKLK